MNIYNSSVDQFKHKKINFLFHTVPAHTVATQPSFVLMGDFNCVDDIHDRAETQSFPVSCYVFNYALKEMVTGLDLVDIWKNLNKIEPAHTFHHHSGSSRLDRVYAGRSFVEIF
jgi:endonuclease/exonuclease/phosphatase family metal-dependent hydrolase